ncbi:putative B3 domain-containing protein Os03g0621600 [Triticum aestivum]|uniref:putative B3 domain-containing protein Os03g0621600 n=1 Tax=Triticum aestivum TaxID=4565 RepID=UPI001D024155|nr:putative B3 domain-containing protein Os03g0621600 [Triticum aestivum]
MVAHSVAKNQEKLVLTVGWGIFVKTFGLEMGDTILFRYNGNSQFSVIIFDTLGYEKALSVVDLLRLLCKKGAQLKKKVNLSSFLFEGDSFSSEDGHGGRDAIVKKAAKLTSAQKEQLKDGYITVRKTKLTSAQKEVVKQKVQSIHSEIPIFVAVMSKTNVDSGFFLTFSRYYANKYLGEEPQMSLQLLGKKWGVRFLDHRCDRRLGSGWRQFAEENNLKMGDICLFELLSNQKRTMEVYIIPANDYNYPAGVQNDVDQEALKGGSAALQREALAHHSDGARDPDSMLLHITN